MPRSITYVFPAEDSLSPPPSIGEANFDFRLIEGNMSPYMSASHEQDAAHSTALHKDSFTSRGGILAMCGKNPTLHKDAVEDYFKQWDQGDIDKSDAAREVCPNSKLQNASIFAYQFQKRKSSYTDVTNRYCHPSTKPSDLFHFHEICH